MLKKVWFMFVLWSVLMVSGCSGGMKKDNTESVAVTDDVVSDLIMAEAESDVVLETDVDAVENSNTSETEEQSGNSYKVEASNTEEPTADTITIEADDSHQVQRHQASRKRLLLSLPHHLRNNNQPHRSRHHHHLKHRLRKKILSLRQMIEEILRTEVRYLRLPSTYHRQNMGDMMRTVWQGLL